MGVPPMAGLAPGAPGLVVRRLSELGIVLYMNTWLVVWNMNFIFHNIWIYIYGIILPIDELIFFKMVKATNHTYTYIYMNECIDMCMNICINV